MNIQLLQITVKAIKFIDLLQICHILYQGTNTMEQCMPITQS